MITYDLSGLYGHPDHISVSEIVTELCKKNRKIRLWYSTAPKKVLKMAKLPVHMAKNKSFLIGRTNPNLRFFIGLSAFARLLALNSHKSQFPSFRESIVKALQIRFFALLPLHEYFFEVKSAGKI